MIISRIENERFLIRPVTAADEDQFMRIHQENSEMKNAYKDEQFVRVLKDGVNPETRWVEGSNYVDVNAKMDERTGRVIMMGAMDNLVKGAAGQAVQNMNLMFGLPENTGLQMPPLFP